VGYRSREKAGKREMAGYVIFVSFAYLSFEALILLYCPQML